MVKKRISGKHRVQVKLLERCMSTGKYEFHNVLVKEISAEEKVGNPFDVTKNDHIGKLAKQLQDNDFFFVHLGKGHHKLMHGIDKGYHTFEDIDSRNIIDWPYKQSVLNESDGSESNAMSVAFNQKIMHHFLYGNTDESAKVYQSRRTKGNFRYRIGCETIEVASLQMEIDQTYERKGVVTVIEAKKNFIQDFAIHQLYIPFRYYWKLAEEKNLSISTVNCCYMLHKKSKGKSILRLYLYNFEDLDEINSLRLIKNAEYRLIKDETAEKFRYQ